MELVLQYKRSIWHMSTPHQLEQEPVAPRSKQTTREAGRPQHSAHTHALILFFDPRQLAITNLKHPKCNSRARECQRQSWRCNAPARQLQSTKVPTTHAQPAGDTPSTGRPGGIENASWPCVLQHCVQQQLSNNLLLHLQCHRHTHIRLRLPSLETSASHIRIRKSCL